LAKTAILLTNLGTPASPSVADVRAYLNEFLMDPYVMDVPWPVRRFIVSAFVLPSRPKTSAKAYQSIWQDNGSPLLLHSETFTQKLELALNHKVYLAMRYGQPGIEQVLRQIHQDGFDEVLLIPLFPQFADSTTGTNVAKVRRCLPTDMRLRVMEPFYADSWFIEPLAHKIARHLPATWDHLLLSYHGLPQRHLTRKDPGNHCLATENCCETPNPCHANCYRHQTRETSRALAKALNLTHDQYSMSYQSRLGRLPWIDPYTDEQLVTLGQQGVQNLVVVCPAFVVDNLETLEEIGLRGEKSFKNAGGKTLTLIPCLNADDDWVAGMASHIRQRLTKVEAPDD